MNTELTDEQIQRAFASRGLNVTEQPGSRSVLLSVLRAVIAADRALQDARHAEELAAYELTVSNLRAEIAAFEEGSAKVALRGIAMRKEIDALRAAQGVPDGWRMVPVEPTPKMVDATWYDQVDVRGIIESHNTRNRRIYCAMIEAAPLAAAQAESAQGVPDGFTLVSTDTLAGWKTQVNTLAVLSGQDRRERTIKLKQEIADALAAAPQQQACARTSREEFEAWVTDESKWPAAAQRSPGGDTYRLMTTQQQWIAWQAARAAAPQPEPKPTSVSKSKRAELEAVGYVVNGVALMHPETRRRVLLDYCGFVGWYGPTPEDGK